MRLVCNLFCLWVQKNYGRSILHHNLFAPHHLSLTGPPARLEPRAESQSRSGPVGGDAKKRAQKPILAVTWVET